MGNDSQFNKARAATGARERSDESISTFGPVVAYKVVWLILQRAQY
jgi:hypothetical protein